jgi:hypothetical protein
MATVITAQKENDKVFQVQCNISKNTTPLDFGRIALESNGLNINDYIFIKMEEDIKSGQFKRQYEIIDGVVVKKEIKINTKYLKAKEIKSDIDVCAFMELSIEELDGFVDETEVKDILKIFGKALLARGL